MIRAGDAPVKEYVGNAGIVCYSLGLLLYRAEGSR